MRTLSINDGLPQSSVQAVFQDRMGYLWIGTQQGIARFDGLVVDRPLRDERMPINSVRAIVGDARGGLWLGTDFGVHRVIEGDRRLWIQADGLPGNSVRVLYPDDRGRIWVGTDSGLGYFNWEHGDYAFRSVPYLSGRSVFSLVRGPSGHLWLGTDAGLYRWEEGASPEAVAPEAFAATTLFSLCFDLFGRLWVGSDKGLFRLVNGDAVPVGGTDRARVPVSRVFEDDSGVLWVGTKKGLLYATLTGAGKELFRHIGPENGLNHEDVYSLTQDSEGNLWIGTELGLCQLGSLAFRHYKVGQGLLNNTIWSLAKDNFDRMLIGTDGGVSILSSGKVVGHVTTDEGLPGNEVRALLVEPSGRTWYGTTKGLALRDGPDSSPLRVVTDLPHPFVRCLSRDAQGLVWAGTDGGGAAAFRDGSRVLVLNDRGLLPHNRVFAIDADPHGNLWLATERGAVRTGPDGEAVLSVKDGLPHHRVLSLACFTDAVWLGTDRGLARLARDGSLRLFSSADGLPDDVCYFLQPDPKGDLWIGTNKGVARFRDGRFCTYNARYGLSFDETNVGASFAESSGRLWFGTYNGVTELRPDYLNRNHVPPPIYLTGLRVFDRPVSFDEGLCLNHDSNYLKFSYKGISLTLPEAVTYRYMLEGVDREWQSGSERSVQYTSIPPGSYRFKVRAVNNDGTLSAEAATFSFRVLLFFWGTWWFITLVVVLLVGGLVWRFGDLVHRNRSLSLRAESLNREVSEEKAGKLHREAQLRMLHARMNPHFLDNALTTAIHFASVCPEKTEHILLLLSRLFRKSFKYSGKERTRLSEEMDLIANYLKIQSFRFQDRLKFRLYCPPEVLKSWCIPAFLVQPLVENAVVHGMEENLGEVAIELNCEPKQEALLVTVSNNGQPLDVAVEELLSGDGALAVINKRMQLLYNRGLVYFFRNGRHHFQLQLGVLHENDCC